jgi:hypothetical protein
MDKKRSIDNASAVQKEMVGDNYALYLQAGTDISLLTKVFGAIKQSC